MKNNIKFLSIILLSTLFWGCKESFLEHDPIGQSSEVSFYKTFANTDQTCTAAYSVMATDDIQVMDILYLVGFGNTSSDDFECGGENTNDYSALQKIDLMLHNSTPNIYETYYGYMYKGIRYANTAIYYLPLLKDLSASEENVRKTRLAEMRFLRAFYHFQLAHIFGGVPIISSKDVSAIDFGKLKRNSIKEVYDFIESELEAVIPDLPKQSTVAAVSEQGRATEGAAKALLAKVLLYESSYAENYPGDARFAGLTQKYDKVLKYAEEVIKSGEYELIGLNGGSFTSWQGGDGGAEVTPTSATMHVGPVGAYRWIFTADANNSKENVFETQAVCDQKGWMVTRGNRLTVYTTVRRTGQGDLGWSFNPPSKYLLAAYGNKDDREDNLSAVNQEQYDATLDPRFKTTVGMAGDSVIMSYLVGATKTYSKVKMVFTNLPTGTIMRKFECSPTEFWDKKASHGEGPFDIRLIRIADVYLMAAEAAWKTGVKDKATNYVNDIRQRARNSGTSGYPKALKGTCTFEDIIHERRIELAGEGWRFFDLVRWNLTDKFISGTELAAYPGVQVKFEKGKNEFFPFTSSDLMISSNPDFQQNPGY